MTDSLLFQLTVILVVFVNTYMVYITFVRFICAMISVSHVQKTSLLQYTNS